MTLVDGGISDGSISATTAYVVQNGMISADLGGAAGLTMTGDGFVQLTGNDTYDGTTIQDRGTLAMSSDVSNGLVTFDDTGLCWRWATCG